MGSGFTTQMINSNKANLSARRKGPFLSLKNLPPNAQGIDQYRFPEVSEKERRAVRKKIQREMRHEKLIYGLLGGVVLIVLLIFLI